MQILLKMENGGEMLFELYQKKAPVTVNNFVSLVDKGFYNGLSFHRVVKDYVIQGGSQDNTCMCPTDFTITGEFAENGYDTGLDHARGALSMARDDDFNSAGTQFFIVHKDAHKLDGKYASFGKLLEGYDILDSIASVITAPKEEENRPHEVQVIESISVVS
ncbi:MAG: peptidylprolyl isomerase [Spirochaetales bacterium]|nr:peptidylprolyl isomerase [Spirochaetales bacterium]